MAVDRSGLRALIAAATLMVAAWSMVACERGMRGAHDDAPAPVVAPPEDPGPAAPAPTAGITAEADASIVPGPPGTVHLSHRAGTHVVEWRGTGDDKITGYRVFRRCPSEGWVEAGFVGLHADDESNRGFYRFEDRFSTKCDYTVAAVGPSGVTGPTSVEIQ